MIRDVSDPSLTSAADPGPAVRRGVVPLRVVKNGIPFVVASVTSMKSDHSSFDTTTELLSVPVEPPIDWPVAVLRYQVRPRRIGASGLHLRPETVKEDEVPAADRGPNCRVRWL